MNSRHKILASISANKPAYVDLPLINMEQVTNYNDLVEQFTTMLKSIGGEVFKLVDINDLEPLINNERKKGSLIINTINRSLAEEERINSGEIAAVLETVHKAYIKGSIGVAENGAVWISESQMINRLLPFICQHLVIVLEKEKLVATMHQAYQQVNVFDEGFGVFIAGPSKTADIEQSLVIGAHGARSMTVYLLQ